MDERVDWAPSLGLKRNVDAVEGCHRDDDLKAEVQREGESSSLWHTC